MDGVDNIKQFSDQSAINISTEAQAKIRKLNVELRRSRRDSKDRFLKLGLWDVRSCHTDMKLLPLMN